MQILFSEQVNVVITLYLLLFKTFVARWGCLKGSGTELES